MIDQAIKLANSVRHYMRDPASKGALVTGNKGSAERAATNAGITACNLLDPYWSAAKAARNALRTDGRALIEVDMNVEAIRLWESL